MVNIVYLYEKSFENLLTLIYFLIKEKRIPGGIKEKDHYEENLLDSFILPDIEPQENIMELWVNLVSHQVFREAYYVFLSSFEDKELIIYYFLKNALKYKEQILYHRNLRCVNKTLEIASKVRHENHKLKGFLRFSMTKENFLYASIAPTHNCLQLLVPHFIGRLKNEAFVIHDVKRNIYCFYDKKKPYFLEGDLIVKINTETSSSELEIEDLWKSFFKTIAISERENKKCQRNFMPKKYWEYMLEMSDEI